MSSKTENSKQINTISFIVLNCILFAFYYYLFEGFFPNQNGNLGHDYSQFLPQLLDGYFWFSVNGFFEIPWFTPSFGGGLPKLPNPQSMYYSIPQFFSFFLNPLTSVKFTFFLFASFGFYGFFFFLRKIFQLSVEISFLGGVFFLFNGFYAYRIIIGHLTFHSFMLTPLLLFFLFEDTTLSESKNRFAISISALLFSYFIYSGGIHLLAPLALIILIVWVILEIRNENFKTKSFLKKANLSLLLGLGLSSLKINSSFYFLSYFPRDLYPLPGVENIFNLMKLIFLSLINHPDPEFANEITVNKVFNLEKHEFEYGITLLPFLFIIYGGFYFISASKTNLSRKQTLLCIILFLLFLLPILFNFYSPNWNEFLKTIPLIKSSSTNVRWFCIYIPTIILLGCISIDKIRFKKEFCLVGIIVILLTNLFTDQNFYQKQIYNPERILKTFKEVKEGRLNPEITDVYAKAVLNQEIVLGNDLFTVGASQIKPYEPIFGYRLENFPLNPLSPGPAMQDIGGVFNLKNPACYVFAEANSCLPGNHFLITQKEKAELFRKYKPFTFETPISQKIVNLITIISFIFVIFLLSHTTFQSFRKYN